MPFKSEAQRRWMHATHPKMAKRWEAETSPRKLPAKVSRRESTLDKYERERGKR